MQIEMTEVLQQTLKKQSSCWSCNVKLSSTQIRLLPIADTFYCSKCFERYLNQRKLELAHEIMYLESELQEIQEELKKLNRVSWETAEQST